jgi:tetratricopeptide (TPR) repeat protein
MTLRSFARVIVIFAAAVETAIAADPGRQIRLNIVITPRKVSTTKDRAKEVVQRTETFSLWDSTDRLVPTAVGFVYVVERIEQDRLLLFEPCEGLRGWVRTTSVVPLNDAERYFSGLINTNPRNTFALLMRGVARSESDNLDKAFADLDQALEINPKYVSALIERACLWQWKNRLDLAIADATKAIELTPSNSFAHVERAVFLFNQKKLDECLADLNEAKRLASRAAGVHVCRALIELERKNPQTADEEFHEALRINPRENDAYAGLASIYLAENDTKKALEVLDEAVRSDPRSPDSLGNRATVLIARGEYRKAIEDLNEVIQLAPNSPRGLRELASILANCPQARLRDGEQAVVLATKACELTGWKDPHSLSTLAAGLSECRKFDEAAQRQQEALSLLSPASTDRAEWTYALSRYKAGLPNRRVGLLEVMGVKASHTPAK